MEAKGTSVEVLLPIVEWEVILTERPSQLPIKGWQSDRLVCLGSPCLNIRHEAFVIGGEEIFQRPLQVVHRRGRSILTRMLWPDLLLGVDLLAEDKKSSEFICGERRGPQLCTTTAGIPPRVTLRLDRLEVIKLSRSVEEVLLRGPLHDV